MEDCCVFVDDGFFKLVKKEFEIQSEKKLKFFKAFRNILKRENLNRKRIFIYDAPLYQSQNPTAKESNLQKKYHKFTRMAKSKNWIGFREGSCVKIDLGNGKYEFSQKGVDALVIMDLYDIKENYPKIKKIILIASDSDFVPVIERMKQKGFEIIIYTYFDRKRNSKFSTSNQMLKVASRWEKLTKEIFE